MNAQQTATRKATKIDWYARWTMEHIVLATDDKGLYCKVASERIENLIYRVDMDEATMVAIRCQCPSYKPCHHMRIATEVFAYKASEVTCEVEAGKWYICDHENQVFLIDGRWLCSCGDTETCSHREAVKRRIEPVMPAQPAEETAEEVAPVVEEAEAGETVWCTLRCCYINSVTREPVVPQPDGKVWSTEICEWVMPPSGEPIDHQAELASAGWYAPSRQVKTAAKAAMLGEISEIKARAARTPDMMSAALTSNSGFRLMR